MRLVHQLPDVVQVLLDKRFLQRAGVLNLDHPIAADEKTGRNAPHAVCSSHIRILIQQDGKCQALFLSESLHNPAPLADIHGQDDETLVVVLLVSLLQSGPLATAEMSPRSPEVKQHWSAS